MDDTPPGRYATIAEKLTWLLKAAGGAGGQISTHQAAAVVEAATGETIAHSTIWQISNGSNTNPGLRTMSLLARGFGVPVSWFFGELSDEDEAGVREQHEMLTLIRQAGIDVAELRAIAGVTPAVRKAMLDLIRQTARAESD